jgi:hypothetical protein
MQSYGYNPHVLDDVNHREHSMICHALVSGYELALVCCSATDFK